MTMTSAAKRIACEQCLRPKSACICQWITPTTHAVEVVVLQHPMEQHNAKGSARLLHLSLPRSLMVTGETFADDALRALLCDPFECHAPVTPLEKHAILLYPPDNDALVAAPTLSPDVLRDRSRLRLIVLDGTWRKSRKMLHLNPRLQRLPRLSLHDAPTSRYLIRRAHRAEQRSTLEATCLALAQLEENAQRFAPLLNAFDGFVAQQLAWQLAWQLARREAGVDAAAQSNGNTI